MTFSLMLIENNQSRMVGTVWADDRANAESLIPMAAVTPGIDEACVRLNRTDDREIPLPVAQTEPGHLGH